MLVVIIVSPGCQLAGGYHTQRGHGPWRRFVGSLRHPGVMTCTEIAVSAANGC